MRQHNPITNLNQSNPVDFLIVGAAKSGTSTLFETLVMHPGIFIPQRKECRYFSCMPENFSGPRSVQPKYIIKSSDEYRSLFNKAKSGQLRGDVSPDYLYYHRNAVPKILDELNAQVPIIIVLRNPIDRAYSNYLHHIRERWEKLSIEAALDAEEHRRAANWTWGWRYVDVGLYAEQVKAYMDNFERVLLLLFEEDIVTGQATGKVLNFLNLEPFQECPHYVHVNVSGFPQNWFLHRLMTDELVVRKVKNVVKATPFYAWSKRVYRKVMEGNLKKEEMALETKERLKEVFREDVARLVEYTGLPVGEFWEDFR